MSDTVYDRIAELERQIESLPKGYISRKVISGKPRFYRQWVENGKLRSQYIKADELESVKEQLERRKAYQQEVKDLKKLLPKDNAPEREEYRTSVSVGNALLGMAAIVSGFQKRDCYQRLRDFLYAPPNDRVCVLFGLRRTGKTTMLRQLIGDMSEEEISRTVYIKAQKSDTTVEMNHDMKLLASQGYRTFLIDEVTLMKDFIDSASLFSDVYAAQGLKIFLSGTDSLGFWFAEHQELYDRAQMIHTTFIPYGEYSRLLGFHDLDEYIRYGGTLRAGETDFGNSAVNAEDASFRDDESTRKYIDTAIARNIQHSLAGYEDGGHFRHLYKLYEAGELTNAINRIIEDMNHRFVLQVLTRDFESHDLGITARNLRRERDPEKQMELYEIIDKEAITDRLREILEIRNKEETEIGITDAHITEIKEYLAALDLIVDCPTLTATAKDPIEHILFTQPGMRYCQAQALVWSLTQDTGFNQLNENRMEDISERILEEVRGRMMEDIVLLETVKALGSRYKVFKYQFDAGEYDMVIYDRELNSCVLFEVKHSSRIVPEQTRNLLDEEKLDITSARFGDIADRVVLYKGDTRRLENDILYLNVEDYLSDLRETVEELFTPEIVCDEDQDEDEPEDLAEHDSDDEPDDDEDQQESGGMDMRM